MDDTTLCTLNLWDHRRGQICQAISQCRGGDYTNLGKIRCYIATQQLIAFQDEFGVDAAEYEAWNTRSVLRRSSA